MSSPPKPLKPPKKVKLGEALEATEFVPLSTSEPLTTTFSETGSQSKIDIEIVNDDLGAPPSDFIEISKSSDASVNNLSAEEISTIKMWTRKQTMIVEIVEECDGIIEINNDNSKTYSYSPMLCLGCLIGLTYTFCLLHYSLKYILSRRESKIIQREPDAYNAKGRFVSVKLIGLKSISVKVDGKESLVLIKCLEEENFSLVSITAIADGSKTVVTKCYRAQEKFCGNWKNADAFFNSFC